MDIWYIAPPPLHVTTSDDILCPVWLIRPIELLTPPNCRALLWVSQGPRENSPCPCPHSNHANRNASTGPTVGLIQSPGHQATTTDNEHTCAGGDSRSSTAQRALTLHSTWQASKLMSWTPHLRQFIVSPACIPFTWFLGPSVRVGKNLVLLLVIVNFFIYRDCMVCATMCANTPDKLPALNK